MIYIEPMSTTTLTVSNRTNHRIYMKICDGSGRKWRLHSHQDNVLDIPYKTHLETQYKLTDHDDLHIVTLRLDKDGYIAQIRAKKKHYEVTAENVIVQSILNPVFQCKSIVVTYLRGGTKSPHAPSKGTPSLQKGV